MPLTQHMTEQSPKPCKFFRVFETYTEDDQKTLISWVADRIPVERILFAIASDNEANRMHAKTFNVHVRGECNCAADAVLKGAWPRES